MGDRGDILRLYALFENRRVSTLAMIDRGEIAELRLRSFALKACERTSINIAADIAPEALSLSNTAFFPFPSDIDAKDAVVTGISARIAPFPLSPSRRGSLARLPFSI